MENVKKLAKQVIVEIGLCWVLLGWFIPLFRLAEYGQDDVIGIVLFFLYIGTFGGIVLVAETNESKMQG